MITCACGCGKKFEEFDDHGRKRRFIHGHNVVGIPKTEASKIKSRLSKLGKRFSEEHIRHLSESHKGKFTGESNWNWKGGNRIAWAKSHHRRRQLKFIPLNKPFDGSDGHHFDKEHVVYIPKDIHKLVWHSVFSEVNLGYINSLALFWLARTGEINNIKEIQ